MVELTDKSIKRLEELEMVVPSLKTENQSLGERVEKPKYESQILKTRKFQLEDEVEKLKSNVKRLQQTVRKKGREIES